MPEFESLSVPQEWRSRAPVFPQLELGAMGIHIPSPWNIMIWFLPRHKRNRKADKHFPRKIVDLAKRSWIRQEPPRETNVIYNDERDLLASC